VIAARARDRQFGALVVCVAVKPSRAIELFAVELIQSAIGDTGTVEDRGETGGPDFLIGYKDGRVAVGETTWHADRIITAMDAEGSKHGKRVELSAGLGMWRVRLVRGAQVPKVQRELRALIEDLASAGIFDMTVQVHWPLGSLADRARALGIDYLFGGIHPGPDVALYTEPLPGGIMPENPNDVVVWLDALVVDPDYLDLTRKLRKVDFAPDERHIFIVTGSATKIGDEDSVRLIGERLPTVDPTLPDWITHAWVCGWSARFGGRWERGVGWSAVPNQRWS
jgi:hypothetical protein